jgi:integrase
MERGHRTLVITRKGGKVVTVPLAPRTARAIDLAIGERCEGPIFLAPGGRRLDRHGAARIVRRITRRAGIAKPVGLTPSGTFSLLYVRVAIAVIGGQADLRPALLGYLLLAAACCGTM